MKRIIFPITIALVTFSAILSSCSKEKIETPAPLEQELITTMRLVVTNSAGFNQTFTYKVENGFDGSSPGGVTKDDIVLSPNAQYDVEVQMLNEKASPAENVTDEIISENTAHLFFFQSDPASGAGSVIADNGSKDANGAPFNQRVRFNTGALGNGTLTVTLKHEPSNKNASSAEAAGGETDAEATFNLKLQ